MKKVFNGKDFAEKKEILLAKKVRELRVKKIIPKLAAIQIGENIASEKYIELKKASAQRIGMDVDVYKVNSSKDDKETLQLIEFLNSDEEVHGIMIQLPLPKSQQQFQQKFIDKIDISKDVDGQKEKSIYIPATVKAILEILLKAKVNKSHKIVVVGSKGEVGSKLLKKLKELKFSVKGFDKIEDLASKTKLGDVIISATGVAGLITEDMVKDDVIIVDVGFPGGDVDPTAALKASFFTPVPGGVGPVTVISLMENLVNAAESLKKDKQ